MQNAISSFTSSIFTVLILWTSISLTHSPVITGVTSSFLVLPLVFNFYVGALIDNVQNKRRVAVMASILRSISAIFLLGAILLQSAHDSYVLILASAIIFGFTMDIFAPVRLVWSKKYLVRPVYLKGMSLMNISSRGSRLAGYLISALLVSSSLLFSTVLVAILYAASLFPILFLKDANDRLESKTSTRNTIKEGISYIRSTPVIAEALLIFMIAAFFTGMSDTVFTVEVERYLHLGASFLSLIFVSTSLGGISGSSLTAIMKGKIRIKLAGAYGISAASFIILSFFSSEYTILALPFFIGLGSGISSPIITSTILGSAEKSKMGRIQGIMDTFGFSFNSVSGILAGASIVLFNTNLVFAIMGVGLLALLLLILRLRTIASVSL